MKDHLINVAVIAYVVFGYCTGLYLILSMRHIWLAIPLLAHSMVFAAYLIHELIHNTLISSKAATQTIFQTLLSQMLLWICGSPYADYQELRYMHLMHHSTKADTTSFDYKLLLRNNLWLQKLVVSLEYVYFPAVEWIMHTHVLVKPFIKQEWTSACKIMIMIVVRLGLFVYMARVSWLLSLMCYITSYNIMVTILRFGDGFQHTYDVIVVEGGSEISNPVQRNAAYEQLHTYSNVFIKWPFLNFLLHLNFGFHNAHHHRTSIPWFDLPAAHDYLHAPLYPNQALSMHKLIRQFHKNRIRRILTDEINIDIGFVGVSFLTDVK